MLLEPSSLPSSWTPSLSFSNLTAPISYLLPEDTGAASDRKIVIDVNEDDVGHTVSLHLSDTRHITWTLADTSHEFYERQSARVKRRRGHPNKSQAEVSPKTRTPRKSPRKSADESGRASPTGEESGGMEFGEEKSGEEIKPFQRL